MLGTANIFVTGGAGTLGHALARRRKEMCWTGKMTVYSTDTMKHELMRRDYPDIQFVQGDIRNWDTLYNAMVGHDIVIHAAAVKVIPASEYWSMDTFDVNVMGSKNVCAAAVIAGVKDVLGISTDKACHPANAYGASKMMMEKIFQEYSRQPFPVQFHLIRYGNILESNGSVLQAWKKARQNNEPINITDVEMTRFWLSPQQAVNYIIKSMEYESGIIYIPVLPALSLGKLFEYIIGEVPNIGSNYTQVPMRPGEKMHEELLTYEEAWYAYSCPEYYLLKPTTSQRFLGCVPTLSSELARAMSKEELFDIIDNG
jgi:UDP-N-acetylglucosamine 4,6-dehydratase/5-epimerase